MGKYSGINTSSLMNAIQTAKRELGSHSLNEEKRVLSDRKVLNSQACKVVDAIEKIQGSSINGSIGKLDKCLSNLYSACTYIQKYQNAERQIESLKQRLYVYVDGMMEIDPYVDRQIIALEQNLVSYDRTITGYLK